MAIYVPDSTRRRRLALVVVGCLVVGLVIGAVIGRATSASVDDAVADVRERAQDAITALQRLPIEYEQALASEGGEDTRTITEALDRARAELDGAYDEITLFGPAARQLTDDRLDTLEEDIADEVPQEEFQQGIDDAIAQIQATFDLTGAPTD